MMNEYEVEGAAKGIFPWPWNGKEAKLERCAWHQAQAQPQTSIRVCLQTKKSQDVSFIKWQIAVL